MLFFNKENISVVILSSNYLYYFTFFNDELLFENGFALDPIIKLINFGLTKLHIFIHCIKNSSSNSNLIVIKQLINKKFQISDLQIYQRSYSWFIPNKFNYNIFQNDFGNFLVFFDDYYQIYDYSNTILSINCCKNKSAIGKIFNVNVSVYFPNLNLEREINLNFNIVKLNDRSILLNQNEKKINLFLNSLNFNFNMKTLGPNIQFQLNNRFEKKNKSNLLFFLADKINYYIPNLNNVIFQIAIYFQNEKILVFKQTSSFCLYVYSCQKQNLDKLNEIFLSFNKKCEIHQIISEISKEIKFLYPRGNHLIIRTNIIHYIYIYNFQAFYLYETITSNYNFKCKQILNKAKIKNQVCIGSNNSSENLLKLIIFNSIKYEPLITINYNFSVNNVYYFDDSLLNHGFLYAKINNSIIVFNLNSENEKNSFLILKNFTKNDSFDFNLISPNNSKFQNKLIVINYDIKSIFEFNLNDLFKPIFIRQFPLYDFFLVKKQPNLQNNILIIEAFNKEKKRFILLYNIDNFSNSLLQKVYQINVNSSIQIIINFGFQKFEDGVLSFFDKNLSQIIFNFPKTFIGRLNVYNNSKNCKFNERTNKLEISSNFKIIKTFKYLTGTFYNNLSFNKKKNSLNFNFNFDQILIDYNQSKITKNSLGLNFSNKKTLSIGDFFKGPIMNISLENNNYFLKKYVEFKYSFNINEDIIDTVKTDSFIYLLLPLYLKIFNISSGDLIFYKSFNLMNIEEGITCNKIFKERNLEKIYIYCKVGHVNYIIRYDNLTFYFDKIKLPSDFPFLTDLIINGNFYCFLQKKSGNSVIIINKLNKNLILNAIAVINSEAFSLEILKIIKWDIYIKNNIGSLVIMTDLTIYYCNFNISIINSNKGYNVNNISNPNLLSLDFIKRRISLNLQSFLKICNFLSFNYDFDKFILIIISHCFSVKIQLTDIFKFIKINDYYDNYYKCINNDIEPNFNNNFFSLISCNFFNENIIKIYRKNNRNIIQGIIAVKSIYWLIEKTNSQGKNFIYIIYYNGTILIFEFENKLKIVKIKENEKKQIKLKVDNFYSNANIFLFEVPNLVKNNGIPISFFFLIIFPIVGCIILIVIVFAIIKYKREKRKEKILKEFQEKFGSENQIVFEK